MTKAKSEYNVYKVIALEVLFTVRLKLHDAGLKANWLINDNAITVW